MVKQLLNKFIVILIIFLLTSGNLMLIGTETYAAFENLEEQKKESSDKNVSFDSYFVVEENNIHSVTLDAKNEAYINFEINIQNGYLKESAIELNNANFEIESIEQQNVEGIVKNSTANKIELNQINSNSKVIITAKIKMHREEYVEANYCSKETAIAFTSNYTNIKGVTKQINAGINVAINWLAEISSNIETNVAKYMQYEEKTIIETNVISTLNDNVLPIKNTELKITAPKIQENLPEEVRIHANSTIGTNGKAKESFSQENWNYNKETGEITINVENQANEEGKVAWKAGNDEYIVTYIYSNIEQINQIELNAQSSITTYTENTVENKVNNVQAVAIGGNYIDYNITATEKTNKGYIYANSVYETPYTETISADISYKDATEGLIFTKDNETYNLENNQKLPANTYYKNTVINKANFEKILGQEGKINIYNGENLIATIDNNAQADENGNIIYNYQENYNNIRIETTKPVEEGIITITNNKALTATNTYSYETQKQIRNIEATLIGTSANQEAQTKNAITNLEETTSKAQVTISKTDLSTVVTNENVELRAILKTEDITDDLYQNPTIRIEMPEDIEKINIKSVNVLFNDELKVATINIENGRIINLSLKGNQTQYVTNNNQGITIIINTDITVNKTATTKETQVTMNYSNQKAINLENGGTTVAPVNIVAPVGLIALNTVTNETTGETATSLGSEKEEIKLERNTKSATAKYTQTVINNENETINGMKILGRIGTQGDNLGSTINAKLTTEIGNAQNVDSTVYYSEKADANSDIENSENKWKTEATQDSKSYLIVVNKEIAQGEELNFGYEAEVPENLEYGESLVSTYNVEYNTQAQDLNKEATPVTLATGNGPVLEATLEDDTVEGNVNIGQVVKYTVNVTNKGTADAENVKINVPVPEGMVYAIQNEDIYDVENPYILKEDVKNIEIEVGKIEKEKSTKTEFLLYAKDENNSSIKAKISSSNFAEIESNEKNVNVKKSVLSMLLTNSKKDTFENDYNGFVLTFETQEKVSNVKAKMNIPTGIEFVSASAYDYVEDKDLQNVVTYNEKDRNIEINIDKIENNSIIVNITVKITGTQEYAISAKGSCTEDNNISSNVIKINGHKLEANVETISSVSSGSYVKVGEKIDYSITIENNSSAKIESLNTKIQLPNQIVYNKVYINENELSENDYSFNINNNTISVNKDINLGENLNIKLETTVSNELSLTEDKNVETNISIDDLGYNKKFNYTIEKNEKEENQEPDPDIDEDDDNSNPNNPSNGGNSNNSDNSSENKNYKITGTAWLDADKSGSLDDSETKLQGITVKAIDESGNIKATTTTKENGTYTLEGLTQGKYIVIFEYDTSKYMLTTYQKEGIAESVNSNVIKGTYSGKTVATTNTIEISDRSIANINIGLIEGSNFDLSLSKKVKQISMANTKKTKTTNYNTQLAKIDLDYKCINNTKVAIEYEITVTNEGDIPGYASKIVDYLPEGFDFSTELNKDWYTSNKNIETRALADTIINPGESQTITLILTKNMNENGNGIYCNTAEIAEDYNEYGQADSDSTPGNNKEGEDDQSSANVILGLKTGGPVTYITLTLSIMALICVAAYEINKRVLKF